MVKYEISKLNLKELYDNENTFMFDLDNGLAPLSYKQLVCDIALVYSHLQAIEPKKILIFLEDTYWFFVFMLATSYTDKSFYVLGNNNALYVKETIEDDMIYITDGDIDKSDIDCQIIQIDDIINKPLKDGFVDEFIGKGLKQNRQMRLVFFTSGSTGKPKLIDKRFDYLDIEAQCLALEADPKAVGSIFTTTAAHHHMYGFTHAMLQPFLFGAPFLRKKITFVETLNNLKGFDLITLITTPGFLKRIDENSININASWYIVSGTEVLHQDTFDMVKSIFNTEIFEFYGSSETGVVARKLRFEGAHFRVFKEVEIALNDDKELVIKAPYTGDEFVCIGDLAEIKDKIYFNLLGRSNDIVKIDGKRIGLSDINLKICENELVKNAATILGKRSDRDIVVSFVVPKDRGILKEPYRERTSNIQKYLYQYFDRGVVPKKVIFLSEIPLSAAGKVDAVVLRKYAQKCSIENKYSFSLISKYENDLEVLISIGEDSVFFDGHFDSQKIFPAVAQMQIVHDVLAYFYEDEGHNSILQIKKMKFLDIVLPKSKFILSMTLGKSSSSNEKKYSVKMYSGDKEFSKGSIVYGHLASV